MNIAFENFLIMTLLRSISVFASLLLALLINNLSAANSHVFVIDGFNGYDGSVTSSTIIKGPYFMGQNYVVKDAVTLFFDINNSTKTNRIITASGTAYGSLYQRNIIKITPAKDVAITNVRIATVNDYSQGFVDNNGNSISRTGNIYEWKGSTTDPLKLRVVSDDANNNLGFTYIEVTYGNSMLPTDPDPTKPTDPDPTNPTDPDPTKPTDPDPTNPTDPDPTKPTDPDPTKPTDPDPDTPTQIAPVIISPDQSLISPRQTITLSCATDGAVIYYTTDGSRPNRNSSIYLKPFVLSVSTGCTVRAIAVSADGQTAEASRRYYLDTVTSISDLFTNGSESEPVTLDAPLQIVYKNGTTAYMLDTSSLTDEYLCVIDSRSYLNGINEGRVLSGIECTTGYDGNSQAAILEARPGVSSTATLPQPATAKLSSISAADINRYLIVKNATVTRRNTMTQGNSVMNIDDRFGVVETSLCDAEANVKGFVALGTDGSLVFRPISIELISVNDPDSPTTPDDSKTTCTINALCVGNGKMEIFKSYNTYTLTPEGMPLSLPASVEKGSVIYIYFPPVKDISVASVVAGATVVAGDSDQFIETVYGSMLPITVSSDLTIVITFVETSGIDSTGADNTTVEMWFDLNGRRLHSKPTASGLYIYRRGSQASTVRIN